MLTYGRGEINLPFGQEHSASAFDSRIENYSTVQSASGYNGQENAANASLPASVENTQGNSGAFNSTITEQQVENDIFGVSLQRASEVSSIGRPRTTESIDSTFRTVGAWSGTLTPDSLSSNNSGERQQPNLSTPLSATRFIPRKPIPDRNSTIIRSNTGELLITHTTSGYDWKLSVKTFEAAFLHWANNIGVLTGEKGRELFRKSGLTTEILFSIWKYADESSKGWLTGIEFQVAMHLIRACKVSEEVQLQALSAAAVIDLRHQLHNFFGNVSTLLAVRSVPYTRSQYNVECIQKILPSPEEVTEHRKAKIQHAAPGPPQYGDPFMVAIRPDNSADLLDGFDDGDVSDDDDIVAHRVQYHHARFWAFFEQQRLSDALVELDACGLDTWFSFRMRVVKALLQNLMCKWDDMEGHRVVAETLETLVYSASDGVHANLLLYYTRALSRYWRGYQLQHSLQDCKRGLKLAKTAGIAADDQLGSWANSDLAELAAVISSEIGAAADNQYYWKMVQDNHDTHYLLRPGPKISPEQKSAALRFLGQYRVTFDDATGMVSGSTRDLFAAFSRALKMKNFEASYILTIGTKGM
ncbi:hypothetical protein ABW20_dc0100563 [Dactylellina cionopaga]|nr:hypothetical protein ABW20_dc0100563 [Dactylellina cionopaga]